MRRGEDARQAVIDAMGPAALVDAAAVAATFSTIDRIADSTGIPIDAARIEPTADFRASLDRRFSVADHSGRVRRT